MTITTQFKLNLTKEQILILQSSSEEYIRCVNDLVPKILESDATLKSTYMVILPVSNVHSI